MSQKLLDVENLTMKFGGLVAIDNLSFSADKDKITSIIGPNGAGKTTVFNCLTGFYKATAGSMFLNVDTNKYDYKNNWLQKFILGVKKNSPKILIL